MKRHNRPFPMMLHWHLEYHFPRVPFPILLSLTHQHVHPAHTHAIFKSCTTNKQTTHCRLLCVPLKDT